MSYNLTCMLTNLPILENETVYWMMLEKQSHEPSFVHSTSLYQPLPMLFTGIHDGYGRYESNKGALYNHFLTHLNMTEENLFHKLHKGHLYLDNTLYHVPIKKKVLDSLVKSFNQKSSYYDSKSDRIVEVILSYKSIMKATAKDLKNRLDNPRVVDKMSALSNTIFSHDIIVSYLETLIKENLYDVSKQCTYLVILDMILSMGRKMYTVPCGRGNSSDSTYYQKQIALLTLKICK